MDPEKKVRTLFSLLNMESPKVQKVSHWLSKNRDLFISHEIRIPEPEPLDANKGVQSPHEGEP